MDQEDDLDIDDIPIVQLDLNDEDDLPQSSKPEISTKSRKSKSRPKAKAAPPPDFDRMGEMPEGVSAPVGNGINTKEEKTGLAGVDLLGTESVGERGGARSGKFEEYDLGREDGGSSGRVENGKVENGLKMLEEKDVEAGDVATAAGDVEVIKVKRKKKKRTVAD